MSDSDFLDGLSSLLQRLSTHHDQVKQKEVKNAELKAVQRTLETQTQLSEEERRALREVADGRSTFRDIVMSNLTASHLVFEHYQHPDVWTPWLWIVRELEIRKVGIEESELQEYIGSLCFSKLLSKRPDVKTITGKVSIALHRLDRDGITDDLLKALWQKFPEEAKEMQLPVAASSAVEQNGGQGRSNMSATRLELVEVFKHIARKIEKLNKALPCEPKELPDAQVDELHAYEEAQEDVIRFVHDRTGIDRWDLSEAVFRVGTSFGLSAHTRRSKRTPENPTLTTDENRQLEQLEALQNRGEHRDLTWILPKLKELDRDEVAQSKLMEVFQNYPDIAKELRLIQNGEDKAATPEGEWSAPMSKAEIARKVTGDHSARPRKIEALLRQWLYQPVPGKNQGRVRLDLMDAHSRKKLEKS